MARVTNAAGTHVTSGSAVHFGGGYMLTANHVSLTQRYVSFDGSTTHQISGGSAVQVTSGSDVIDLKVFQLTTNPGTSGVNPMPEVAKGLEGSFGAATQIGWGWDTIRQTRIIYGLGAIPRPAPNAGASTTLPARQISLIRRRFNYDFESIYTALDSDATSNEAEATVYDFGSGFL